MALLTVRAAAERLGVGYSTFKRWVHSGRVRTTQTEGGHHRVSESEVERLLARQKPDATRTPSVRSNCLATSVRAKLRLAAAAIVGGRSGLG